MPMLAVEGQGDKWQDDYLTIADRVDRYMRTTFRRWPDREDRAAEARLLLMQDLARKWQPGGTVRLWPRYAALDVMRGRSASGCPRGRLWLRTNRGGVVLRRARAKLIQVAAEIDFRLACARLEPRDRDIVELLVAGHSINAVRRRLRHCRYKTVAAAARRCLALLES
jgi:hypothetical protein